MFSTLTMKKFAKSWNSLSSTLFESGSMRVIAIPSLSILNSYTTSLRYSSVNFKSESRKSKISPFATLAPLFLPIAGKPPSTIIQPYSCAMFRVLSVEFASATIIS